MLRMPARQIRHPVLQLIPVKSYDHLLHHTLLLALLCAPILTLKGMENPLCRRAHSRNPRRIKYLRITITHANI